MLVQTLLSATAIYAGLGLCFAIYFVTIGVGRLDSIARSAPVGVRLLLLPGAAALWPVLLRKCRMSSRR